MNNAAWLGVQLGTNGFGPFGREPERDLPAVLDVVKQSGFDGAEIMANVMAQGADAVAAAFKRAQLEVAALHVFFEETTEPGVLDSLLEGMARTGCKRLIFTSGVQDDPAFYKNLANTLNETGARSADMGIAVYYHPHDAEYLRPKELAGLRGVDLLRRYTQPDLVRFNIDTYWAWRGRADPVAAIQEFSDRCDYYHIKDGTDKGTYPLGDGEASAGSCLQAMASQSAALDWVVYEDADARHAPAELCRRAMDFILRHDVRHRADSGRTA